MALHARRIIGVGQPLRGDDGAGPAVIEDLRARMAPGVAIVACGADPASLMEAWSGAAEAVVVDAVQSGAAPGTIHRIDAVAAPLPARFRTVTSHGLGLAEAIELARALGRLPRRLDVIGIEGQDFSAGAGLSTAVADAVARVVRELIGGSRRPATTPIGPGPRVGRDQRC